MSRFRFFLLVIFTSSIFLFNSCRLRTDEVVDSNGSAPVIVKVSISPDTINTDLIGTQRSPNDTLSILFNIQAMVVDADGESSISSVPFSVVNTHTQATLAQGFLMDNGISPDAKSNDSLFTGSVTVPLQRSFIGNLNVVIQGESTRGYLSSSLITPVVILRADHAPRIDSVVIPDTVHVTQTSSMTMTAYPSDSDGIGDISGVYQYTQTNTYRLTDNGDGSYSRTITWSAANFPPSFSYSYVYNFVAYDYSGKASSAVTKTVVVLP